MPASRSIVTCVVASCLAVGGAVAQCPDIPVNPDQDTKGAGFEAAVAMSADGTVALAGGPGFDLGGGVVRAFERSGEDWVEGTAFDGIAFVGEGLGMSVCMSDDGRWAVISAPAETHFDPGFLFAAGAVYLHERDETTGVWSLVERWISPDPGANHFFGTSCAMSSDGNTVVIGDAFSSEGGGDTEPDAVWVVERVGGVWGGLEQLVPDPPVAFDLNLGTQVAISDNATLIAASAPRAPAFTPGATGQVCVFEKIGGVWTHTDTLERPEDGASFNFFGAVIAFDGDTLLAVNPSETTPGPDDGEAPPICVYHRAGASYPSEPDALLYGIAGGGPIVIEGDTLLVGRPLGDGNSGEALEYARDGSGWEFVDRFVPTGAQEFTGFGAAIAMSADASQRLIGEPSWGDDLFFDVGRLHFPGRVFQQAPFEIDSASSSFAVDVSFLGIPVQQIILDLLGLLDLQHPVTSVVDLPAVSATLSENRDGGMRFEIPDFSYTGPIDLGLGDANPQLSLQMSITSDEASPCVADFAEPLGELGFSDVLAYLAAFGAGCP